jgi:hypothetical protein
MGEESMLLGNVLAVTARENVLHDLDLPADRRGCATQRK